MTSTDNDNYVKILFRVYSGILEEWIVETMWAEIVDSNRRHYKLDSIPFYVQLVASGDIVFAEHDESGKMLTFREVIEKSGNSTIHVVIIDKTTDINSIRSLFEELGCISERLNDGYFAMEVPADVDYQPVKIKLTELANTDVIDYAESCLSSRHQY